MAKLLLLLFIGLGLEATGVVFLKKGLEQIGDPERISVVEILSVVQRGISNPNILLGVFFEAVFFGCLLVLMANGDISFIWPLTALGFVLTTLAARFYLQEQVPSVRWAGVLLIMIGAALISYSEHTKRKSATAPAALKSATIPE